MTAALNLVSRHALGRFNPFGVIVTDQQEIMRSSHPTTGQLVVHEPFSVNAETKHYRMLSFDPQEAVYADDEIPEGMYQVNLQFVIHHEDRVGAFLSDGMAMSFQQPVSYHPIKLLTDITKHLRQQIQQSTHTVPSLIAMKHDDLDAVIFHGQEAEGILHAHLYHDEVNQSLTLTIPLCLRGDYTDELDVGRCKLSFMEDIDWMAGEHRLSPALRAYLSDIDAVTLMEDAEAL